MVVIKKIIASNDARSRKFGASFLFVFLVDANYADPHPRTAGNNLGALPEFNFYEEMMSCIYRRVLDSASCI